MILRYGNGRPDVHVLPHPAEAYAASGRRSRYHSHTYGHGYHRQRAGSFSSDSSDSPMPIRHHRPASPSRAPEEIRVLPSQGTPSAATSHHSRSKSLTRVYDASSGTPGSVSGPQMPHIHSKPVHPPYGSHQFPTEAVIISQTHPGKSSHGPRRPSKHVPPVVYAPSRHPSHPQYAHPHQVGPNGIIYSHSAPMPSTHYTTPGVPHVPSHNPSVPYDDRRMRGAHHKLEHEIIRPHSSAGHHSRPRKRHESGVSYKSQASGETYYVVPGSPTGHKAQLISRTFNHYSNVDDKIAKFEY
ncbi:hypothetical protein AX16_008815 [Volvariella volvacea WC 439]|nr:hypothetical protein AX16_008815 [Volvariella volvacea WC 439]